MQKFSIGDSVLCINTEPLKGNDKAPKLIKGTQYPVKSIILDSEGNQHLDVGLISRLNFIRSWDTKEELKNGDKIHWCHPSRFVFSDGSLNEMGAQA